MKKYNLDNGILSVDILSLGACIYSIRYKGVECVLRHDDIDTYRDNPFYLGATVGPLAGRIGGSSFSVDGIKYSMEANEGENFLHSGPNSITFKEWKEQEYVGDGDFPKIVLKCISAGDETGIPGNKQIEVEYSLNGSTLLMKIRGESDKATYINITNHTYFNLNKDKSKSIANHLLKIKADRYVELDDTLIAKSIAKIDNTPFDFREYKLISDLFNHHDSDGGYHFSEGMDHPFLFENDNLDDSYTYKASLICPETGIGLSFNTSYPAANIYTANAMDGGHRVNGGIVAFTHQAICFEGQYVPDFMNHDFLNGPILRPGQIYNEELSWTFFDAKGKDA